MGDAPSGLHQRVCSQADIKETVFVELPRDFAASESGDYVLKLKKSLYGLKQALKMFFDHLRTGL
jgi:hypothetical protein